MQKILSKLRRAIQTYNLIQEGDKILVGLSGGKDSLILLKSLVNFQKFNLVNFEIKACIIDMFSGQVDYSKLEKFCNELNVELIIEKTDIASIIFDVRNEKNPCSLCAKMRRGALNSVANKIGYNKLALGHHLDDVVNTFIMSLFFEGRLNSMSPSSYMSKTKITLIRPLFLVEEKEIIRVSKDLPILKNKCPNDKHSKRTEIDEYLKHLEKTYSGVKKRIITAILNSNLL